MFSMINILLREKMGSNVKDSKITPNKISLFTGSLVTNEITTIVQYKNMESIFFALQDV